MREREKRDALAKLKFSTDEKGVNNGVMHVLSIIHLETPVESQSVSGAQCPSPRLVTFCSR